MLLLVERESLSTVSAPMTPKEVSQTFPPDRQGDLGAVIGFISADLLVEITEDSPC